MQRWKHTAFLRFFLPYVLVLLIVLLTFSLLIESQMSANILNSTTAQNEVKLQHTITRLKSEIDQMNVIAGAIRNDPSIIAGRYLLEDHTLYSIVSTLRKYMYGKSFFNDIIIHDTLQDKLYNVNTYVSNTSNKESLLFRIGSKDFTVSVSRVEELKNSGGFMSLLPQTPLSTKPNTSFALYVPSQDSVRYTISFLIPESGLISVLSSAVTDTQSQIYLFSKNLGLLSFYSVSQEDNSLAELFLASFKTEMPSIQEIEAYAQSASLLSQNISMVYNLHLFLFTPTAMIESGLTAVRYSTYLFLGGIALIALIAVVSVSVLNYRPIRRMSLLARQQQSGTHAQQTLTDLQFVEHTFTHTLQRNALLSQQLDSYRISVQTSILDSLVGKNNLNYNTLASQAAMLFEQTKDSFLVACKVGGFSKECDRDDFVAAVGHRLQENELCLVVEQKTNMVLFILKLPQSKEPIQRVEQLLLQSGALGVVTTAISEIGTDPLHLAYLCENAKAAFAQEPNSTTLLCYSEMQSNMLSAATYPFSTLKSLSTALDNADWKTAKETLTALLTKLEEESFSGFLLRTVVLDITNTLAHSTQRINLKFSKISAEYMAIMSLCQQSRFSSHLSQVRSHLEKIFSTIATEFSRIDAKELQLVEFIEEHYASNNFSVTLMADQFAMSASYMSAYFKSFVGITISEYVWKLRLDKALSLLEQTSMSIKDIAADVGFDNVSSFIRKFKESTDQTPIQYRNESQSK